ncbi:unnamed protein product [Adineta ricciae]|uniref:THAP-type domain-containing protein n=1 Tax=Adineta ricciae TaxID=249248 RepID=A0A814ZLW4_ADIRI|nr:unnamed protein product [Adineta ricciae]
MVHNCAIISCPLHNRRNIRKGLLFHSFPVDQHRFELWRQTVINHCSQTLSLNRHSKICYRHFHPDDYIANHTGLTRYLKATAIPTIFTETKPNSNLSDDHNHVITLLPDLGINRKVPIQTATSSSLPILPSNSSSSEATSSTLTDTKAKRLLSTIDKLHQIQNANKSITTSKLGFERKQTEQDEVDHNLSSDDSVQLSQVSTIDHKSLNQKYQTATHESHQQSSRESDFYRSTQHAAISTPKTYLEDALFKFLEQANLLQYYSAFIEQGGDDLKQLAEAQNDDFQEIITLVGMASKPLHIKRFKKALDDYRQSMGEIEVNHPYSPSARESSSDRHSIATNNSMKLLNHISSEWSTMDTCKTSNTHQLLDDSQRKLIADEAERLAKLLPLTAMKQSNGRSNISKDLLTTMNLPRDFEDRWQRIRKYSAIYNRFDSKKPNELLSLNEILINEAAAAICFHRPEFLTRRDELLHLTRRVLQNIGMTNNNILKRPLTVLTCDTTPAKQLKLNIPLTKPTTRQRDPDTFRLMWHNREAKVEQIPIEIEALRCEQNKLLQQLKQNTMDPASSSLENGNIKKQIDEISKKIEQLSDEEKNLRRLIRKKNMRLRAKERQQQKLHESENHSSTLQDSMAPILPIIPPVLSFADEFEQNQQASSKSMPDSVNNDAFQTISIKEEKVEPSTNLSSPILKSRQDISSTSCLTRSIEQRREEIYDRTILFNQKLNTTMDRPIRSTQRQQSSPITNLQSVFTTNLHTDSQADHLPIIENEQEIIESKSFIHNLDFNIDILKGKE